MSEERKKGRRAPKEVTPASDKDIAICTAIILLELASADSPVTRFERVFIINGIMHLFRVSEESAVFIVKEGENYLANMTSSSLEAERLRAELNPAFLTVIGELVDKVICTDGEVSDMEIYLRNRFRMILGLPERKLAPLVR